MSSPLFILHVDDDPALPEGVAGRLEQDGYRLVHTADPEEAMRLAEQTRPCLVLMEVELSGCDGLDLLAGIRAAVDAPVLVVSRAPRNSGLHGEAIALGIADFISKPVRPTALLDAIRETVPPPAKTPPVKAPAEPTTLDLSGDLRDTPVPELLARLRRRGASGVLAMGRGDTRIGVQLRNGSPVALGSNRPYSDGGLGSARRAEALLYETFCWSQGPYGFSAQRQLGSDVLLGLEGDPQSLVLFGVLDASPLEQIRERLAQRASLYVSFAEESGALPRGVKLTRRQRKLLADQSGSEKLSALLASRQLDERLLYGLWVAGWVELHTAPTVTLTETPPPRRAPQPVRPAAPDPADSRADAREALAEHLGELSRRVMGGDDFDALDLEPSASDAEVYQAYRRVLEEIPDPEQTRGDLTLSGRSTRIRDRIESAYQNLKDADKRDAYALLRAEEQQDRDAKPSAKRAIEGERWFRKGKGRLELRRYEDAVEAFGMASHLDPGAGEYLAHLGYALYLSKPGEKVVRKEALEHVANGIKRSPRCEIAYVYLGRILKAQGDVEAARKVFTRALRIQPECRAAQQELRVLEMRERKGKGLLSRLLRRPSDSSSGRGRQS